MFTSIANFEKALDNGQTEVNSLLFQTKRMNLPYRWHPLGFVVCTMLLDGPWKARLHVWPALKSRPQKGEIQIHDHIFEFNSWILAGAVENIEYEIHPAGKKYSLYEVQYSDHKSILKKTEKHISLNISSAIVQPSGSNYSVRAGQLHETRRVSSSAAVTILLTRDVSNNDPIVAGPLSGEHRYEYTRAMVSDAELRDVFAEI